MDRLIALSGSHRELSLDEVGRLAYPTNEIPPALGRLLRVPGVVEAVILSTCNRTEVYAVAQEHVRPDLERFLIDDRALGHRLPTGMRHIEGRLAVATHLFRVAAGLESMVIGEGEIQGQVTTAHRMALDADGAGRELDGLFRCAVQTGRRVRRDTVLGTTRRSLGCAAVDQAAATLPGGLHGRSALVLGAGKIARVVVERLRASGAVVSVCSRTEERARRLAGVSDLVLPLPRLLDGLAIADVAVCCSSAPHLLIDVTVVGAAVERRHGRPLLLVDLAVPRDVDPEVRLRQGVRLIDLEDLGETGLQDAKRLREVLGAVERIVEEEVGRYLAWAVGRRGGAVVAELRQRVERLCEMELDRSWRRSGAVDRQAATTAVHRSLAKLFHALSQQAKAAALAGDDEFMARLSRLLA